MKFSVQIEQLNMQTEKLLDAAANTQEAQNALRAVASMLEDQSCGAAYEEILLQTAYLRRTKEQLDVLARKLQRIVEAYTSTETQLQSVFSALQYGDRHMAGSMRAPLFERKIDLRNTTEYWSKTATFQRIEPWLEQRIWEAVSHGDL